MRAGWLLTWCLVGCGAEIGGDDPSTDGAPRLADAALAQVDAAGPPDAAPAETTALTGIADTFLRFNNPALNYGITERLCADTTTDDRRVLLRIDLSSLPAGAEVVSADLHIWTGALSNDLSTQTFSIYRMLEAWNEGSQDAATGFASWDDRTSGTAWTVAGAGVGSRDDVVIGSFVPDAIDTEYVVPLEPEIVAGWAADPASNFGVVIVAAGQDGGCFASSEAAVARRPSLVVSWLAP